MCCHSDVINEYIICIRPFVARTLFGKEERCCMIKGIMRRPIIPLMLMAHFSQFSSSTGSLFTSGSAWQWVCQQAESFHTIPARSKKFNIYSIPYCLNNFTQLLVTTACGFKSTLTCTNLHKKYFIIQSLYLYIDFFHICELSFNRDFAPCLTCVWNV